MLPSLIFLDQSKELTWFEYDDVVPIVQDLSTAEDTIVGRDEVAAVFLRLKYMARVLLDAVDPSRVGRANDAARLLTRRTLRADEI